MRWEVVGPNDFKHTIWIARGGPNAFIGPGDGDFTVLNAAPDWTVPGVYRLRWLMDAPELSRPIVIAQRRYRLRFEPSGVLPLLGFTQPVVARLAPIHRWTCITDLIRSRG